MPVVPWVGTGRQLEDAPGINRKWQLEDVAKTVRQLSKLTDTEWAQWKQDHEQDLMLQHQLMQQQQMAQENEKKRKRIKTDAAAAAAAAASSQRNDTSESNKKPRIYHEVSVYSGASCLL